MRNNHNHIESSTHLKKFTNNNKMKKRKFNHGLLKINFYLMVDSSAWIVH